MSSSSMLLLSCIFVEGWSDMSRESHPRSSACNPSFQEPISCFVDLSYSEMRLVAHKDHEGLERVPRIVARGLDKLP